MKTILFLFITQGALTFYTPGLLMKDYEPNDSLNIEVSQIDSLLTHVAYDYFIDA